MTTEITKTQTMQGFEVKEVNNSLAYIEAISKILLYASLEDAATSLKEDIPALEIFDSKEELNNFLRETEVCSVCGKICLIDDECYSDYDTGDACCTKCCFYDEGDDVYRKGTELEFRLKEFATNNEYCPHCGSEDYVDAFDDIDNSLTTNIVTHSCNSCNKEWREYFTLSSVESDEVVCNIPSEHEDLLAAENKAMGDYLEKQIGFTQEDVSNIANSSKQLFCVHVVCNNTLEHYSLYTNEDKVKEKYLELCREWYKDDGVENHKAFLEDLELNEVQIYDNYYGSTEYHDACDYAHVTWEKLS